MSTNNKMFGFTCTYPDGKVTTHKYPTMKEADNARQWCIKRANCRKGAPKPFQTITFDKYNWKTEKIEKTTTCEKGFQVSEIKNL